MLILQVVIVSIFWPSLDFCHGSWCNPFYPIIHVIDDGFKAVVIETVPLLANAFLEVRILYNILEPMRCERFSSIFIDE